MKEKLQELIEELSRIGNNLTILLIGDGEEIIYPEDDIDTIEESGVIL